MKEDRRYNYSPGKVTPSQLELKVVKLHKANSSLVASKVCLLLGGATHILWLQSAIQSEQSLPNRQCVTVPKMLNDTDTDTFSGTKYF